MTYIKSFDAQSFYRGYRELKQFPSILEQYSLSDLLVNRQYVTSEQTYIEHNCRKEFTMFKTKDGRIINIEALTGTAVYEILCKTNPALAASMKKLLLNTDPKLGLCTNDTFCFQANYKFGEKIIENKEVFASLAKGGSISVNDLKMPDTLLEHLSYIPGISNPVGMLLDHESESFLPEKDRIISYGTIKAGQIFGYSHIMDAIMKTDTDKAKKVFVSNWNLNAGARTVFVLPPISENLKHAKMIKKYEVDIEKPNDYMEQCNVFRAHNVKSRKPWKQSVLFFSKYFLDNIVYNPEYLEVHQVLAGIHRSAYNIWHTAYPRLESDLNKVIAELDLTIYSSYAINIVKHLYLVGAGGAPAFVPATDESMLPKKLIENMYTKGYGLIDHWPIIMQPQLFNIKNNSAVYYGIKVPTLINYNPKTFAGKTTIALLYEVYDILSRCQEYIQNKFEDHDSLLYEVAKTIKFTLYHSDPESEKDKNVIIKSSTLIPEEDPKFFKKGWTFPHLSQFTRGCIKIEPIII